MKYLNIIILFLSRLADVVTTQINVDRFGWSVEGNPFVRFMGERGWFVMYELLILVIAVAVFEHQPNKNIMYKVLSILGFLVAGNNLLCFYFTTI